MFCMGMKHCLQIGERGHGPGYLRYFVLGLWILSDCQSVLFHSVNSLGCILTSVMNKLHKSSMLCLCHLPTAASYFIQNVSVTSISNYTLQTDGIDLDPGIYPVTGVIHRWITPIDRITYFVTKTIKPTTARIRFV